MNPDLRVATKEELRKWIEQGDVILLKNGQHGVACRWLDYHLRYITEEGTLNSVHWKEVGPVTNEVEKKVWYDRIIFGDPDAT